MFHIMGETPQGVDFSFFSTYHCHLQANTEQENWVGVLQQVDIPAGGDAAAFLPKAVDFANNRCWGTLSCAVIVDAANLKTNAKAVDTAIANLRYGAITINMPSIVAFAMGHGPWGAYPGATPQVQNMHVQNMANMANAAFHV